MLEELLVLLPTDMATLFIELFSLGSIVMLLMEAFKKVVPKKFWALMTYILAELIVFGYAMLTGSFTWLHLFAGVLVGASATGEYRLLFEKLFKKTE